MNSVLVAPLVGAWIEITCAKVHVGCVIVAPLVGAWIEIILVTDEVADKVSLPSWERGLKLKVFGQNPLLGDVAPLVGAWIEITFSLFKEILEDMSLPSWERGLKSLIPEFAINPRASLPSWERGLK